MILHSIRTLSALAITAFATLLSANVSKPNVVFIIVDDLGWRDLSVQGSDFYETPNVDSLANRGARFTQGYATCQVCSPARASLMTGRFPARMKTTDWFGAKAGTDWKRNTKLLPPDYTQSLDHERVTVAEAFKDAGYKTFFAGKWHLGKSEGDWPEHHGYDINKGGHDKGSPPGGFFAPYNNPRLKSGPAGEALPLRLADETASFIKENADKPFFATLCFYTVHAPAQTTRELWDKYRAKADNLPHATSRMDVERRRPIRVVQDNPIYAGMIETMDTAVGRVMEALEESGQSENTIVVFTSDHGGVASGDHWATSNLPLRGGKGYQWEGGLRVPFLISWPGKIDPSVDEESRVSGADIYPTLLELAGLPLRPEEHVDGISLADVLEGDPLESRPLYWHYPHYGNQGGDPSSVVVYDDWKLIHYHEGNPDELYRLEEDPMESDDVSSRFPMQAARLRTMLDAWLEDVDADFPMENPNFNSDRFARDQAAISKKVALREKNAAEILQADWQPDPTWWGSEVQGEVDTKTTDANSTNPWLNWHRPADNNAFITTMGNNHDSVLFVEPELEYPYHLIISHTPEFAYLWRAKKFSWKSEDWELVSDQYVIGNQYEYDDGVNIDGTYYIYEGGKVYTFTGPLEDASGKWEVAGSYDRKMCDDIGVYYEDGVFHIFGEYGDFPHGHDGTSLSHMISKTGLGDWEMINTKAVNPNTDGGHTYGVGDATIVKIDGMYYLFCDRESQGSPYKITLWQSDDLYKPFTYLGKAIKPRFEQENDWDNHRIQDGDIAFIPELGRFVMTCNMMDIDGNPGGDFPTMKPKQTRVIGTFYSDKILTDTE